MHLTPRHRALSERVAAKLLRDALALQLHTAVGLAPGDVSIVYTAILAECNRMEQDAIQIEVTLALGDF